MSATLLQKLGVYIDPFFLSKSECEDMCLAIRAGLHSAAGVYSDSDGKSELKTERRRSLFAAIPEKFGKIVDGKVRSLKPTLEKHFNDRFDDKFESAKFLLYKSGHFFAPHTDDQLGRRINMSIYLNDQSDDAAGGSYSGGELKIYGLLKSPGMGAKGIGLRGKAGMLVAYPASVMHEITPVSAGERCAIVTRFLERGR